MENNEKFDYIKEKLGENSEEMPKSLDRKNIVSSLDNISQEREIKIFTPKRIIPIAASFAIVILSVIAVRFVNPPKRVNEQNETTNVSNEANAANESVTENTDEVLYVTEEKNSESEKLGSEYDDIIKYFAGLRQNSDDVIRIYTSDTYGVTSSGLKGDMEVQAAPIMPGSPGELTTAAPSMNEGMVQSNVVSKGESFGSGAHGQTNTQVENVDEADIIKNDGTYLYIVRGNKVLIYRASDLKKVSSIALKKIEKENRSISDIYLSGKRLVIMTTLYEEPENPGNIYHGCCLKWYGYSDAKTECLVYSLENIEKPELVFTQTQSGFLRTSRLVGNTLYTVSQYGVNIYSNEDEKDEDYNNRCIPEINGKKISRDKIDFSQKDESSIYVVISACDIASGESNNTGYAYFGLMNDLYCTENKMYLSNDMYLYDEESKKYKVEEGEYTQVYSVSLTPENIEFNGKGLLKGQFLNQFSMDEYNGYFRCALTSRDDNWQATSTVTVLDKDFNEVSSVTLPARNEEVKAVRFMGDVAYVVTYENTDPLFVLDMSDPENPKVDGEVKLPGFSAYIHPINDRYIVGVGEGGNNFGTDGSVKVTIFDISDKKHPQICSESKIKNAYSEIEYNHKAFLYYPEKNIIAIPVKTDEETKNAYKEISKYYLLKVSDGKLSTVGEYIHEVNTFNYYDDVEEYTEVYNSEFSEEYIDDYIDEFFRGTYIDETFYTISEKKICAFNIESGEKIKEEKF